MACRRSSVQVRYPPSEQARYHRESSFLNPVMTGFFRFQRSCCVLLAVPDFVPLLTRIVPYLVPRVPPAESHYR